jgi:hypothetical protein
MWLLTLFTYRQAGGATVKSPVSGWTDQRLSVLFGSSTSGNHSQQTSAGSNTSKKASGGAIAGGVIGALAVLAVIGGFVFLCLRRRRAQQDQKGIMGDPDYAPVDQAMVGYADNDSEDAKKYRDISSGQLDSNELYEIPGDLPPRYVTVQTMEMGDTSVKMNPKQVNASPVELA